ncbi:vitamin B12 receptor precursor, partial [gut metagenome]
MFSCLHREVRIGILAVATLTSATPRLMATSLRSAEGSEDVMIPTEADTLALGETSVSASRAPLAPGQAARQVITLSREDLAAAGVKSLNDVLKLSATTDVRQRGGFGIQTDISIASGTHDQIAIFLNGVPL